MFLKQTLQVWHNVTLLYGSACNPKKDFVYK